MQRQAGTQVFITAGEHLIQIRRVAGFSLEPFTNLREQCRACRARAPSGDVCVECGQHAFRRHRRLVSLLRRHFSYCQAHIKPRRAVPKLCGDLRIVTTKKVGRRRIRTAVACGAVRVKSGQGAVGHICRWVVLHGPNCFQLWRRKFFCRRAASSNVR